MKAILIDSNKTIENHEKVKENKIEFFCSLEEKYQLEPHCCINYVKSFYEKFGAVFWEYHPIFWRCLVKDLNLNINYDKLYNLFLDFYEEHIELYDDVIDFLHKCKDKYVLILVANGNEKRLERLIKKFNLTNWFEEVVVSGETPYKKPDRFMFEFALIRLGIDANDAIMIGDRYDTDIKGAKRIGIRSILLKRSLKEKVQEYITPAYMPDFTVYNLYETWDLLSKGYEKKWNNVALLSDRNCQFSETKIESVLLLAGGKGSRLGEMGEKTQKCMLPINNIPLLFFQLNVFKNAGCKKFVIVVNHLANQVKEYFGNGNKFGVAIYYLEGTYVSTYDAMYNALPYLDDTFYYCHGNIVFDERLLEKLWEIFCRYNTCVLAAIKDAYSVTHAKMIIDKNKVLSLSTRPKEIDPNIYDATFMGVSIYNKDKILKYNDSNMNGMVEKNIEQQIENQEDVRCYEYKGKWWHIETINDYNKIYKKSFWEVNFDE